MPGLADMHTHMLDRDELLLYLVNGVTTIRNLHGLNRHLAWRDSLERNLMAGPRLLTSGPILDGDPPTRSTNVVLRTEAEAEAAVVDQATRGFDYIKIYDNLPRGLYQAIGRAATARVSTSSATCRPQLGSAGYSRIGCRTRFSIWRSFYPSSRTDAIRPWSIPSFAASSARESWWCRRSRCLRARATRLST